jgi:hypothetical protein
MHAKGGSTMRTGDDEDPSGITELASEEVAPIEQELRQRLVLEVGEQDALAIESALLKAFINGMRAAAAATAASAEPLIEQAGGWTGFGAPPVQSAKALESSLPWVDPWAARYGGAGH